MTLAIVHTRAQLGVEAPPVTVEVHLSNGLPSLTMVGLPETAVKESKDRVRSAILNSHLDFPARRITVNLAPADLPKEGGRYDLAIAIGILAASGQVPCDDLHRLEFLGELALSGELRGIKGALPAALACTRSQRSLILSEANGPEVALTGERNGRVAGNLLRVCAHLHRRAALPHPACPELTGTGNAPELAEVRGQEQAKRALEVAAAGGHNMLMFGPPGTGKTMLASRLPGILPPIGGDDALDVAAIYSVVGECAAEQWRQRPFRAPHHSASAPALVGGGSQPRPGEISLAHGGVLFLDELPEFQRQVLEVLREPLESGEVRIARARAQTRYPARFQLIAAMNPCPCGYFGADDNRCRCTPDQIRRYRSKVSGPLLDRIDLHVPITAIAPTQLHKTRPGESSAQVQARVVRARERALGRQGKANCQLQARDMERYCGVGGAEAHYLERAVEKLGLSTRAYHRVLKVSRTLADMADSANIGREHLAEALSYRALDRSL